MGLACSVRKRNSHMFEHTFGVGLGHPVSRGSKCRLFPHSLLATISENGKDKSMPFLRDSSSDSVTGWRLISSHQLDHLHSHC